MAEIRTFCSIRPREDMADKIAALPYDVYSRQEARELTRGDMNTFLRIDRPETQFPEDYDMYAKEVYEKAVEMFKEMCDDGRYERDEKPSYYIYQLTMNGRQQNGIVACAAIDDYCNNVIKKHENTREDKEQDRIRHVDYMSAQTGPIFLAYRSDKVIKDIVNEVILNKPLYDFTSEDGITHKVWRIDGEEEQNNIHAAFANMASIYIADGHHRCASAVKVGIKRRGQHPDYDGTEEFNYFLSVLFPDDELKILPYNRVVTDLNGYSKEDFIKEIEKEFEVVKQKEAVQPKAKGTFGMYVEGDWYLLTAKEEILSDDPVDGLDVSILQDNILNPVLGIKEPRTDKRIDFIGGIRGLSELEKRCGEDMKVAFSMYPTSIEELFAVADAGRLMPPKSTWFEPKLRSGIFIHEI